MLIPETTQIAVVVLLVLALAAEPVLNLVSRIRRSIREAKREASEYGYIKESWRPEK